MLPSLYDIFEIYVIYDISYMTYDKIPYVNMGVESSVMTSTMQPPAPKLSKV